jgi:hypothetical protein
MWTEGSERKTNVYEISFMKRSDTVGNFIELHTQFLTLRMPSSGMLGRVALVEPDVSEERNAQS